MKKSLVISEQDEDRFWSRVDMLDPGGHWLWTGGINSSGYGRFCCNGNYLLAHRLSYRLSLGEFPDGNDIDHQPTCPKACVRPDHLRSCTHKENAENRAGAQANNYTSAVRGVTWNKKNGKWQAQIKHHQKYYYIGLFSDLRDAEDAVIKKRNELFTHNDVDRIPR